MVVFVIWICVQWPRTFFVITKLVPAGGFRVSIGLPNWGYAILHTYCERRGNGQCQTYISVPECQSLSHEPTGPGAFDGHVLVFQHLDSGSRAAPPIHSNV